MFWAIFGRFFRQFFNPIELSPYRPRVATRLGHDLVDVMNMLMLLPGTPITYREVQLDFTPDMEVFNMLFERCLTKIERDLLNSI